MTPKKCFWRIFIQDNSRIPLNYYFAKDYSLNYIDSHTMIAFVIAALSCVYQYQVKCHVYHLDAFMMVRTEGDFNYLTQQLWSLISSNQQLIQE